MHGDFSLNPLTYRDRVSRVLSQQGRVQLDSDANEQTEAILRFVRGLALDVIGAHGGVGNAFELVVPVAAKPDVQIRWGVYYVDGIRCLNAVPDADIFDIGAGAKIADGLAFKEQRDYVAPDDGDWTHGAKGDILFYLDVFERHVSAAEDESLREVALLGPDTTSRAVVVWQVRTMPVDEFNARLKTISLPATWQDTWDPAYLALNLVLRTGARMRARAVVTEATEPCTVSPDARYRGTENRLFRVEIHDAGAPGTKPQPTFKWSADNASIVYPVRKIEGKTVHLDSLGRDDRTAIQINDWVEVVDDHVLLMGKAHPLVQVVDIGESDMTVTLSEEPEDNAGSKPELHPILRRWGGAPVPLREGKSERDGWFELADGVEVQFSHATAPDAAYRTGDYWLIPTRTATGDVQWPHDNGHPRAVAPHGIEHHYAPLAVMNPDTHTQVTNFRRHFKASATV